VLQAVTPLPVSLAGFSRRERGREGKWGEGTGGRREGRAPSIFGTSFTPMVV